MADPTPDPTSDESAPTEPTDEAPDAYAAMAAGEQTVADAEQTAAGAEPDEVAPPRRGATPKPDTSKPETPKAETLGPHAGDHTPVNSQTIDTLAAIDEALAGAPAALVEATLPQVAAQAVGLALLNAVNAQQNAYVTANATVLAAVNRILALRGATSGAPSHG